VAATRCGTSTSGRSAIADRSRWSSSPTFECGTRPRSIRRCYQALTSQRVVFAPGFDPLGDPLAGKGATPPAQPQLSVANVTTATSAIPLTPRSAYFG